MSTLESNRLVLGIWDGHDSGAALVRDGELLAAVNEERLTRRKLEVAFPNASIEEVFKITNTDPKQVSQIAWSTSDAAKTLTRVLPKLKEEYYQLRRRKKRPGLLYPLKKSFKYKFTELPSSKLTRYLSKKIVRSELEGLGFRNFELVLVNHHAAHAAAAAFSSGFDQALVVTIDGIGDGSSGSIWRLDQRELVHLEDVPGASSLGIFFEHVTNLLNMRELEDEGKVMALANYAYPVPDSDNPMLNLFELNGIKLRAKFGSLGTLRALRKILWQYPSEQFAYMAQRTLEKTITELVKNSLLHWKSARQSSECVRALLRK